MMTGRRVAALLFLGVLASWRLATAQCPDGTPPPCGRQAPAAAAPAANSVAVLYFENRSADSADAYLADGLTEEVISRLSGVERLTVRSRHLVRRYRGSEIADPSAVGRVLNVRYIVTGTVRRAGDRLRVSAELILASGGTQVWGRQFDQAGSDVFAIQEAVARDVATGIMGRLVAGEQRAIVARPTESRAAYDAFLRGNFLLARRDSLGFARAIQEYESALRLDPRFTDALARLSLAYGLLEGNAVQLGMPQDTVDARAIRTATEAVRLAPDSPDAWTALAVARRQAERDPESAIEAGRRAVALDSTNAEAHHQLGGLLDEQGLFDSAAAHFHRALAIEPARPVTLVNLGNAAAVRGQWREMRRWIDSALVIDPEFLVAHTLLLQLHVLTGDTAAARGEVERWQSMPALRFPGTWVAALLSVPRQDTAAVARFRAASFPSDTIVMQPVVGYWVATLWLAQLGDREGALLALEHTRRSAAFVALLLRGAALAPLHNETRFQRVLAEARAR